MILEKTVECTKTLMARSGNVPIVTELLEILFSNQISIFYSNGNYYFEPQLRRMTPTFYLLQFHLY